MTIKEARRILESDADGPTDQQVQRIIDLNLNLVIF